MAKQTSQRRRGVASPSEGNAAKINCLFCHRTSATTVPRGWDWFTGYFDRTVYVCPVCQKEHWREVTWLYKKALFAPLTSDRATSLDEALQELQERQE